MKFLSNDNWRSDERGTTAAEYALLISLIALVILGGVSTFSLQLQGMFDDSCDNVALATGSASC